MNLFIFRKKILYSRIEGFRCNLREVGRPVIFDLKDTPSHISKLLTQKEDSDYNFFATVTDKDGVRNDTFNCQIYRPPEGKPIIIIHCIQKKFRKRKCKLKIRWMVIDYYTDSDLNSLTDFNEQFKIIKKDFNDNARSDTEFLELDSLTNKVPCLGIPVLSEFDPSSNHPVIGHHFFKVQKKNQIGLYTFAYCIKEHQCAKLPNFTFHILIVSNYPDSNSYGISSFSSFERSNSS